MLHLYMLAYNTGVSFLAHSKNELMRWRGVCRLSVCLCVRLSVNFFARIATTMPKIARSLPNLHRMVITWTRIHVVLKVKVKVKGHVLGTVLYWHEKRSSSQGNGRIATKLAHDGQHVGAHPCCAQGRGQGQRSRETSAFVPKMKIASCRRQMAGLPPNLHKMVPRCACIQDVLKVKVKVKGCLLYTSDAADE